LDGAGAHFLFNLSATLSELWLSFVVVTREEAEEEKGEAREREGLARAHLEYKAR
jgi:hypothetical protein